MLHLLALLALLGETAANCAYGTSLFPRLANVPVSDFSYDGLSGPLNWYGLNETANSACDKGTQQSPIVIDCTIPIVPAASVTWTVDDYPSGAEFENLGTNVEVVVNGSLIDNTSGTSYSLAQFHFHTPAEHRVNNVFYPMEMHWVFESAAKDYAVIALLVDLCTQPDCTDPVLSAVFSGINDITSPGDAVMSAPLYFEELTSKFTGSTAWRYNGSLTTPPCKENVDWLISTRPLYIDLPTWLAVRDVIKYNARYSQDYLGDVNLLLNAADELDG